MRKWITFDLDGTLMQNPFGAFIFPEIIEKMLKLSKKPYDVYKALVNEHLVRMKTKQYVAAYDWDDIVATHLQEMNIDCEIDVEKLVKKHSEKPKVYLLEKGILNILQQLKRRGYSLAAVTNGYRKYQLPVMSALGLSPYFDKIITPERAGVAKPDEKIFAAVDKMGQICAHIGDRLDHDVHAANLYGIPSILIYRNLPLRLQTVDPNERYYDLALQGLLREKWCKEKGYTKDTPIPKDSIPTAIIYSISELLDPF